MDEEVHKTIEEYKDRLIDMGIYPQRVVLYGSYANGSEREDSDLDLLVVSEDFEGMGLWDRLALLGRARVTIDRPMEILGATPAEIENDNVSSFVRNEILSKGVNA